MSKASKPVETLPATSPALVPPTQRGLTIGGRAFVVKKQLTRTVMREIIGTPYAVMFQGAIYQGEDLKSAKAGAVKMEPARLCDVLNLETGELQSLILYSVLEGEIHRAYPGDSYIGKSLLIRASRPEGKRYRTYEIAEIEASDDGEISGAVIADGCAPVNRAGEPIAAE
jgi:hypothetical protein